MKDYVNRCGLWINTGCRQRGRRQRDLARETGIPETRISNAVNSMVKLKNEELRAILSTWYEWDQKDKK